MEVDRAVSCQMTEGWTYKISFKWFQKADVLGSVYGMATAVVVDATKLFPAMKMKECISEWYDFDLDAADRKSFRRLNAQYFN